MAASLWKWCERSEWHFQRCMSSLGSSFKVPEHQSTAGFLWSSLGWGHRRIREGKFPLNWRSATVLGCNDLTNILNSTHIFNKSRYGSSTFHHLIALETILTDLSAPLRHTSFIHRHQIASCIDAPLQLFFWGLIVHKGILTVKLEQTSVKAEM